MLMDMVLFRTILLALYERGKYVYLFLFLYYENSIERLEFVSYDEAKAYGEEMLYAGNIVDYNVMELIHA